MKLQARIREDGITASATRRDKPSAGTGITDRAGNWYNVKLAMGGRTMAVPFYMGPAHTHEPTAAEVLSALTDDAAGYENASDVLDWASEYGYEDTRGAGRIYQAVERLTGKLRVFLGDRYDAYLWETERD